MRGYLGFNVGLRNLSLSSWFRLQRCATRRLPTGSIPRLTARRLLRCERAVHRRTFSSTISNLGFTLFPNLTAFQSVFPSCRRARLKQPLWPLTLLWTDSLFLSLCFRILFIYLLTYLLPLPPSLPPLGSRSDPALIH